MKGMFDKYVEGTDVKAVDVRIINGVVYVEEPDETKALAEGLLSYHDMYD